MEKQNSTNLAKAKTPLAKAKLFLKALGPGIVTGAADDDPSGIGTYTAAGAAFGTTFLWSAFLTWPLMAAVQMACSRIGMVTGDGLASALEKKFSRPVLIVFCFALFFANTLNVGADLSAMADCTEMLGLGSSHIYVILFGVGIAWATVRLRYVFIANVLKWLALSLFTYIIATFIVGPDWSQALRDTFSPHWPSSKAEWSMLVAILGTTISPYLFFWQASQEVEEEKAVGRATIRQRIGATPQEIFVRRLDVGMGTLFSNVVMYFIILATALTLHKNGILNLETSRQAAEALMPIAGKFASLLYTFGLLGVGLLAIPTLTGSAAYALAETFGWDCGLDAPFKKARAFYIVILMSTLFAIAFDFSNINPIKALYMSAIANGLLAPFLLFGILVVIRDSKLMNGQPGPKLMQAGVALTFILMLGAAIGMFYFI